MTKKNAMAVAKNLDLKCEAYLFATKVGTCGCVTASKNYGDGWFLLTLFINLLEEVMRQLNVAYHKDFRKMLIYAFLDYLKENAPKPKEKPLSDKERAKRIKRNEQILAELEAVL